MQLIRSKLYIIIPFGIQVLKLHTKLLERSLRVNLIPCWKRKCSGSDGPKGIQSLDCLTRKFNVFRGFTFETPGVLRISLMFPKIPNDSYYFWFNNKERSGNSKKKSISGSCKPSSHHLMPIEY